MALDGITSRVVVAQPTEALIRRVDVTDVAWIRPPEAGERLQAKVRYQMRPASCALRSQGDGIELTFEMPQKPTAPGQVAAIYAGDELLGGGIVQSTHRQTS